MTQHQREGGGDVAPGNFVPHPEVQRVIAMHFGEFMGHDWPEPQPLLVPYITVGSVNMIAGQRGAGKSWLAADLALTAATGSTTLADTVHAPRRFRTLLVDGENMAPETSVRLRKLKQYQPANAAEPDLHLLTPEMCLDGIVPNIATYEGQIEVGDLIAGLGIEFLILDNLSVLAPGVDENKAHDYDSIQAWTLSLKARGVSSLIVAHVGKDATRGPRGSSKRTDALSTLLELRQVDDGEGSGGNCKFELHVTKARHRLPYEARAPKLITLEDDGWRVEAIEPDTSEVFQLAASGKSLRAIEAETGISKSRIQRLLKTAKETAA